MEEVHRRCLNLEIDQVIDLIQLHGLDKKVPQRRVSLSASRLNPIKNVF